VHIASAKQKSGGQFLGGEGEKQLELERRNLKNMTKVLNDKLGRRKKQQKQRIENTLKRKTHLIVALVGYTNAGKSALLNNFAKYEAMESRDQLFQTLHTVSRSVKLKGNSRVIMVDTIGRE
jgi:GTP-binding protein HflX